MALRIFLPSKAMNCNIKLPPIPCAKFIYYIPDDTLDIDKIPIAPKLEMDNIVKDEKNEDKIINKKNKQKKRIEGEKLLCSFCNKMHTSDKMFLYFNLNNSNKDDVDCNNGKLICFYCAVIRVDNIHILQDLDIQDKKRTISCSRCRKKKPSSRIKSGTTYCYYCALKQKWRRSRKKYLENKIY